MPEPGLLGQVVAVGVDVLPEQRDLAHAAGRKDHAHGLRVFNQSQVLSTLAGVLLFIVNSVTYYHNTAFRLKMIALILAAVNMWIFEKGVGANSKAWEKGPTPQAARVAGALSLTIWVGVLFIARWIGFTKGYDFTIPPGVDLGLPD